MPASTIHVGDLGTVGTVSIVDETGAAVALAGATVDLVFGRPDATTITIAGAIVDDGATGEVTYTTAAVGPFDTAGRWALQAIVTFTAAQRWTSTHAYIDVAANIL